MLNQVVLVGRINEDFTIEEVDGKKIVKMTLAVSRSYKNSDGEYETDFISCVLWNGIAEKACEYCKKGDVVGVKGKLEVKDDKLTVIAEKVSFLSSKQEN